jgi:hypothetical protein
MPLAFIRWAPRLTLSSRVTSVCTALSMTVTAKRHPSFRCKRTGCRFASQVRRPIITPWEETIRETDREIGATRRKRDANRMRAPLP